MIDLRELLDERSANPPSTESLRLAQIERRIVQRRHRRVAAVAAVVTLLFGGYLLRPAPHPPPDPAETPSPTPTTVLGFSTFVGGTKLVAANAAPASAGRVSVTWTPSTLDLKAGVSCDAVVAPENRWIRVLANGHDMGLAMTCGDGVGVSGPLSDQPWRDAGLQPGRPATLTAVLDGASSGTLVLAVYERVPFGQVPLPSRPATLKSLDCQYLADRPAIHSEPHDPLKPMSITIVWSDYVEYHHESQTPGFLHVAINGVRVQTLEHWDYDARDSGSWWHGEFPGAPDLAMPKPGDQVTITITPEHVTGAWMFSAFPGKSSWWSSGC